MNRTVSPTPNLTAAITLSERHTEAQRLATYLLIMGADVTTLPCILRRDELNAAKMHQLRVYRRACQVHPRPLLEPSVFRPQGQAWWPL